MIKINIESNEVTIVAPNGRLGWLTPEYLVKIIRFVQDGIINRSTADMMIGWYMKGNKAIFSGKDLEILNLIMPDREEIIQ